MTQPHTDPIEWLRDWLRQAEQTEPGVPDAMQLATADADGRPSVRTVLLKEIEPDGLVFFTNYGSRKARELEANGHAAVVLHWKTLQRQVIAEGSVERVSAAESDAYHATRPRGSQIGAWASDQSRPLASAEYLTAKVAALTERFEGQDVDRPPHWGGYRIRPVRFEFWQGLPSRLHDRVTFERDGGGWTQGRVYP